MKPTTTEEILDLLDAPFTSTALGAALELGLFRLLDHRPLDLDGVADALKIPRVRCGYWLQLLVEADLIEEGVEGYQPSPIARQTVLETFSHDTWALLAQEARERLPGLCDLPVHIRNPGSAHAALGIDRPTYVARMTADPARARRFTCMLYELHQELADQVAMRLDLAGAKRLMDLGGGSGVISSALARRHPGLEITIVDIENVCVAGRELAVRNGLEDRLTFHALDFMKDELPSGFDTVLECDIDIYGDELFRKVMNALVPGGRFVIVDQLAPDDGIAPPSRTHWALDGSMRRPEFMFPTAERIKRQLVKTGFDVRPETPLSLTGPDDRFTDGMTLIEAYKPAG
jgi:predicted O-methyltransferase YrrM